MSGAGAPDNARFASVLRRPTVSFSNLFCCIVVARLWYTAGSYRCRTGELAMAWAAIISLGSAVTATNAWLSAALLIVAFATLILAEPYASSAALGPTIFVLILFGGVSTSMSTMRSKSVVSRVFGSSLALFDFQCLQALVGFDQVEKANPQGPLVLAACVVALLARYAAICIFGLAANGTSIYFLSIPPLFQLMPNLTLFSNQHKPIEKTLNVCLGPFGL